MAPFFMKKRIRVFRKYLLCVLAAAAVSAQAVFAAVPYPGAAEGQELHGWLQNGDYYWYYDEAGQQVSDGFSADGYYLDRDGRWRHELIDLLGQFYSVPDRYTSPEEAGNLSETYKTELNALSGSVLRYIGSVRVFRAGDAAITYAKRNARDEEKVILGLYKDDRTGGWRLRVAGNLGDRTGRQDRASTYDYAVFQFLLARVSHVPATVADAIYGSWQGRNIFGITGGTPVRVGDVTVRVKVSNGAADYYISGAQ